MAIKELLIAIPTYGGSVKTGCLSSVYSLGVQLTAANIKAPLALMDSADIVTARNVLASALLTQGATHILFVDSDMQFDPSTVAKMIKADEPIIGCVYPRRRPGNEFVVWH